MRFFFLVNGAAGSQEGRRGRTGDGLLVECGEEGLALTLEVGLESRCDALSELRVGTEASDGDTHFGLCFLGRYVRWVLEDS